MILCPICNTNNAPMVWMGKDRGWICEDCVEKLEKSKNMDEHNKREVKK